MMARNHRLDDDDGRVCAKSQVMTSSSADHRPLTGLRDFSSFSAAGAAGVRGGLAI